jgi:hypothetical protein
MFIGGLYARKGVGIQLGVEECFKAKGVLSNDLLPRGLQRPSIANSSLTRGQHFVSIYRVNGKIPRSDAFLKGDFPVSARFNSSSYIEIFYLELKAFYPILEINNM